MRFIKILTSFFLTTFILLILLPTSALAQFTGNLGSVSGTILWGAETATVKGYQVRFIGNTTGFETSDFPSANGSYNLANVFPADTYAVTLFVSLNSGERIVVDTKSVTVQAGQAQTLNFDLSSTTGFVKGNLKINGVNSEGTVQFCAPAPAPCTAPVAPANGPIFPFQAGGFRVPLLPGNYRAHVATNQGSSVGIVPITVTAGQVINDSSLQFQLNLGSISGTVLWGTETATVKGYQVRFIGNTTGFETSDFPSSNGVYNLANVFPADTYTATVFVSLNSGERYVVDTKTVTVQAGQTQTLNFDLANSTGFVKGNLKINGVNSEGTVQFCAPAPAPCTAPLASANGRIFSFSSNGFRLPILPGNYRVHVATNQGSSVGIVPITVTAGQVINDASLQFQLNFGTVSGTVLWGTETATVKGYQVRFIGNTTGFETSDFPSSNGSYNLANVFPADTYAVTLFVSLHSSERIVVDTKTVVVQAGQTQTLNFDLANSTGFVKGNLKINGVNSEGTVQFCAPAPASCTAPVAPANGPIFPFQAGGFRIPLLPGNYRAQVTTNPGVLICKVSINVNVGTIINNLSCNSPSLPPTTTIALATQNDDGTYSNPTVVTLSATADTGYTVANTFYKIDGGSQQTYSTPFTVSGNGQHNIEYWSVDNSGVQEAHKTKEFTIYVNKAPVVDPLADAFINVGGIYNANGSFTDTDSTSWSATVDYGDIGGPEPLQLNGNSFSLSHQYATAGTYTVTVVVRDDQQATGTTFTTVVVNGAPQIANLTGASINKGQQYTENGSFTDSDSTSWTATVDYGEGAGEQPLTLSGNDFNLSHIYTSTGTHTVTVKVTDNQGAVGTKTASVQVNNLPEIAPLTDATIEEGDTYSVSGSFSDTDSTSWTATVDYGEGAGEQPLTLSGNNFTLSNLYKDNKNDNVPYSVTVKITDNQGAQDTQTVAVTVENVVPSIGTIGFTPTTVNANVSIDAEGTFADVGVLDTHAASWNWGDTNTTTGTVTESNGSGSVANAHTYTNPGTYTVTLSVTDKDGGVKTKTAEIIINGPPQINSLSGDAINKGETYTENGSFVDDDSISWTATVNYGDGSGFQPLTLNGNDFALNHTYTAAGIFTVTVKVVDNLGEEGIVTTTVSVNAAPQINALSGDTIYSADTYTENGSFTDSDSTSWTATVDYGDGAGEQPLNLNGQTFSLSHQYPNSGDFTVTVKVTDSNGAYDTETAEITVNNRPPVVEPISDVIINEGQSINVNGSFTDADSTSWTATVDYGEGTGPEELTLNGNNFTLSNTFETPNAYDVTVVVKDEHLNSGQTSFTVHVNGKPEVDPISDVEVNHQDTFVQSGTFEDDDSTSWTATVDYGEGSGSENLPLTGKNFALEYTYLNPGIYTVTVKVTDNQGAFDTEQLNVKVNAPASINTFPGGTINEGSTYTHTGFFSDSDSTSWTGTVNYGSGTQSLPINPDNTFNLNHLYNNNGAFTITVSINDNQGAFGSQSALLTVNNIATSVGTITAPIAPVPVNTSIAASANFTDVGVLDVHTTTWNWGDGTTSAGSVSEINGSGSVTGNHTYTTAGIYEVTVSVHDGTIAILSQPYQYIVVISPNTTKVDGGVDFDSPQTASVPNAGKVDFGFRGDYINNVLHGGADLSFGNTDFKANSLDWLVINGDNVRLQATGTIKHQTGTYRLFISATDLAPKQQSEGVDLVRVKLINTANNAVIYDSQANAPDTVAPTTTISKGDIEVL